MYSVLSPHLQLILYLLADCGHVWLDHDREETRDIGTQSQHRPCNNPTARKNIVAKKRSL